MPGRMPRLARLAAYIGLVRPREPRPRLYGMDENLIRSAAAEPLLAVIADRLASVL